MRIDAVDIPIEIKKDEGLSKFSGSTTYDVLYKKLKVGMLVYSVDYKSVYGNNHGYDLYMFGNMEPKKCADIVEAKSKAQKSIRRSVLRTKRRNDAR